MKINTNQWNKLRYTFFTPVYDSIAKHFDKSREKSIEALNLKENDKVLIVGAGTGLDLNYIPKGCEVTATDITPSMVNKIKERALGLNIKINALVMDGQNLAIENDAYDVVILHLILAVIPDSIACIQESERVLKKGGQIAVFDKFVKKGAKISFARRVTNTLTNTLFTDITRSFETMVSETQLKVISDNDANFGGNFRRIQLTKP